jgi:hypothetical protein
VELPVCRYGLCFHYSLDYATPLCHGDPQDDCCQLATAEGCVEDTAAVTALVTGFDEDMPIAGGADGFWHQYEHGTQGWRTAGPLAVTQPSGLVVSGMGRCLFGPGTVACCPATGGECVRLQTDVATTGQVAFCEDGVARFASSAGVILLGGKAEVHLEAPIGQLPDHLGPVAHLPTDSLAVPVASGAAVALFQKGLLAREIAASQLPGGVLGMALDASMLYIAAAGGKLVAVGLGPGLLYADDWQTPDFQETWVAGPVLTGDGEVVVANADGELLFISQSNRSAPLTLAGVGLPRDLVALHGGAVAALVAQPAAVVTRRIPQEILPWLPTSGNLLEVTLPLANCVPRRLLVGNKDGRMLVQCETELVLGVSPAPMDEDSPWPRGRGRGGAGCFE